MGENRKKTWGHPPYESHRPDYLLLTWYGKPTGNNPEVLRQNRLFWHRLIYRRLTVDDISYLVDEKIHDAIELKPFSDIELADIKEELYERLESNGAKINYKNKQGEVVRCKVNGWLDGIELKIDCSTTIFEDGINLSYFIFPCFVDFTFSHFAKPVDLTGARFLRNTAFEECYFEKTLTCLNTSFGDFTYFNYSNYLDVIDFSGASFFNQLEFYKSNFHDSANFENAYFAYANFEYCNFNKTNFHQATFKNYANFCGCLFEFKADFTKAVFINKPHFDSLFQDDCAYDDHIAYLQTIPLKNEVGSKNYSFNFKGAQLDFEKYELDEKRELMQEKERLLIAADLNENYEKYKKKERWKNSIEQFFLSKALKILAFIAVLWLIGRLVD